jgi:hypothetical protein
LATSFTDLVVVGFGLGERVIQDDVNGVIDSHRRVELRDNDPVAVAVEHVGHAHQHHVVVVHERHDDRPAGGLRHAPKITPLGVYFIPLKGFRLVPASSNARPVRILERSQPKSIVAVK